MFRYPEVLGTSFIVPWWWTSWPCSDDVVLLHTVPDVPAEVRPWCSLYGVQPKREHGF